ncbi:MAG: hypothetical protein Faunusvirus1_22 [Faunusvirus sp.]|jgi:hypothetical protein|uniref:Uncharacterized protein n=1 Tax=Faunusvirus sp. TaxID=2487766 RepID=A0A3G4ZVS5_9VIRU|nr:MAG: hypothetical protein Faunusvirus1_22 [Faunusvirus sp.]
MLYKLIIFALIVVTIVSCIKSQPVEKFTVPTDPQIHLDEVRATRKFDYTPSGAVVISDEPIYFDNQTLSPWDDKILPSMM